MTSSCKQIATYRAKKSYVQSKHKRWWWEGGGGHMRSATLTSNATEPLPGCHGTRWPCEESTDTSTAAAVPGCLPSQQWPDAVLIWLLCLFYHAYCCGPDVPFREVTVIVCIRGNGYIGEGWHCGCWPVCACCHLLRWLTWWRWFALRILHATFWNCINSWICAGCFFQSLSFAKFYKGSGREKLAFVLCSLQGICVDILNAAYFKINLDQTAHGMY